MNVKHIISVVCAAALFFMACTKTEEPPRPVGTALPFTDSAHHTLAALIDSLPEATIYRAAFHQAPLQAYMDSLRKASGSATSPYTLFIPTDAAFKAYGIHSAEELAALPPAQVDTLLRYLAIPNKLQLPTNADFLSATYNPMMYPDKQMERSRPGSVFLSFPYVYTITPAFDNGHLLINGKQVAAHVNPLQATDGTIYLLDTVVEKPLHDLYQLVMADTSLSLYMAALRCNDSLYIDKGILGSEVFNIVCNDTVQLQFVTPQANYPCNFTVLFAPDNNAFRKAGLYTATDVAAFINRSYLATAPPYTQVLTNMDSILVNHRLLCNNNRLNLNVSYFYTADVINTLNPLYMNNSTNLGSCIFWHDAKGPLMHRGDYPNGQAAYFLPGSDQVALNGVLHKMDNLLLPTN